jgi:hypothetical protein
MREEASKLLYETPTIGILRFHNEGPICQSGNVLIDPGYDNEIEVPVPFSQPWPGFPW